ncbi:MAG: initiation factor 2B-related protein [Parcubacteria group bacterium Gr01-1014_106]|nr:MAG: initiation factor 2B-related protein [Parcubacteria group bacterium Gr01-1014_106]
MTRVIAEAGKSLKSAMGNKVSKRPKFKAKPGQIDYARARWAPVINCVLKYRGKILLVQRGKDLNFYPGYWNGISGFLDDHKSLTEKVATELKEELGISKDRIRRIRLGEIFDQEEPAYRKTWIVHPVLVDVTTDEIKLDWEASTYVWTSVRGAQKLNLLPGFSEVLKRLSIWIEPHT